MRKTTIGQGPSEAPNHSRTERREVCYGRLEEILRVSTNSKEIGTTWSTIKRDTGPQNTTHPQEGSGNE